MVKVNNKSQKRNNIRITNYNINNNGNIFTYQKIFKNNESQNIDINRKNKLNQLKILYNSRINSLSKSSFNDYGFMPTSYQSIFDEESTSYKNLTEYGLNPNKYRLSQKGKNSIQSKDSVKFVPNKKKVTSLNIQYNFIGNRNNFQKSKIICNNRLKNSNLRTDIY